MKLREWIVALLFVAAAVSAGSAFQEESGICEPEVHAAKPCHCLAMGGYQNCDAKTGHYSYQKWVDENNRRQEDIDPKTKKPKQKDVPKCEMACKEDQCMCCAFMDKMKDKRKAVLTIPYDRY